MTDHAKTIREALKWSSIDDIVLFDRAEDALEALLASHAAEVEQLRAEVNDWKTEAEERRRAEDA